MEKFIIKTGSNSQYYFSLKADNGQKILTSEWYTSKVACQGGIDSVKSNAKDDSKYEKKTSTNNKYYFNLKASNGQIIGTSEMYESSSARDAGIESLRIPILNVRAINYSVGVISFGNSPHSFLFLGLTHQILSYVQNFNAGY